MGDFEVFDILIFHFFEGDGVKPHAHNFYQLYHVTSGSGTMLVQGETIYLKPGMSVFIGPNQLHELCKLESGTLLLIDVTFDIHSPAHKREFAKAPQWQFMSKQSLDHLWQVRSEWNSSLPFKKDMADSLLEQYMYFYIRTSADHPEIMSPQSVTSRHRNFTCPQLDLKVDTLNGLPRAIADYVIEHCFSDLSLDRMAEELTYNRNYLCKVFKNATRVTIISYANHLRIAKALELIRYSDKKLTEISELSGFRDIHYFSKVFKKFTGYTPGDLRDEEKYEIYTDIMSHRPFRYRYFGDRTRS